MTCCPILAGLIAPSVTSDSPLESLMQYDGTTIQAPLTCRVMLTNQLMGSILISWSFLFPIREPWTLQHSCCSLSRLIYHFTPLLGVWVAHSSSHQPQLLALVPPKHSWRTLHHHSCGAESPVSSCLYMGSYTFINISSPLPWESPMSHLQAGMTLPQAQRHVLYHMLGAPVPHPQVHIFWC